MSTSDRLAKFSDDVQFNPYASPLATEFNSADSDAEVIRNAHLYHEASIRSIGSLYYLAGLLFMLIWVPLIVIMFTSEFAVGEFEVILLAAGFALCFVNIAVGRGLRQFHRPARVLAGLFSIFGLLAFPIGTIINAYILYLLFSSKGNRVFAPEYQEIMRQTPHLHYRHSPLISVMAIILLLLFLFGFSSFLFMA